MRKSIKKGAKAKLKAISQKATLFQTIRDIVLIKIQFILKRVWASVGLWLVAVLVILMLIATPIVGVVSMIYNSPFAIFFPALEEGETVQSVVADCELAFQQEVQNVITLHSGYEEGEFLVGVGTRYYVRMPREEQENAAVKQYGVEWNHGVYLGNRLENMNLMSIYERYADRPYSMGIHMQVEKELAKQEKDSL